MAETRNVYGTLVPDELNEDNVEPDDLRMELAFCTYATTQHVLLRASGPKKIAFLCRLFHHVKHHRYMKMIHELLLKYTLGKLPNYLNTLDSSEFIDDVQLNDNDRSVDSDELEKFFDETARWFKCLDNPDLRLGIFLSFLSICGNNVTREILIRTRRQSESEDTLDTKETSWIAMPRDDYAVDIDWDDPDAQELLKKRKEWNDAMTKYRSKVERSMHGFDVTKKTEAALGSEKNDRKGKENDVKKTKVGSKKKYKEEKANGKKEKKGKSEIDFIQLMPIWVSINIFKYLDAKTLKIIKDVNKYWDFVVACVSQEEKARKKMNSWIESIQEEYNLKEVIPSNIYSVKPEFRFNRISRKKISCAAKVHDEIRKLIDVNVGPMNDSAAGAVANNPDITLRLPVNNLQPLTRLVPAAVDSISGFSADIYIHRKIPCIHYDNITIDAMPIADLNFTSESLDEVPASDSFEYWPVLFEKYPQLKLDRSERFQSLYESRNITMYKSDEFERLLAALVDKSIANFQGTSQKVTFLADAAESVNSLRTSPAFMNTKKSMELALIKANIRKSMSFVQDLKEPDTPTGVDSHPVLGASYVDYLVKDDLLDEETASFILGKH